MIFRHRCRHRNSGTKGKKPDPKTIAINQFSELRWEKVLHLCENKIRSECYLFGVCALIILCPALMHTYITVLLQTIRSHVKFIFATTHCALDQY